MRLIILFMPPAFMLILGLIWTQASIHRLRQDQGLQTKLMLQLVGAILLTVIGIIGVAWVINEVVLTNSGALPPPQPSEVCC